LIVIAFCLLGLLNLNLTADIENNKKPLKGEWDFHLEKIWELDKAGEDILVETFDIKVDENGNVYTLDWKHAKFFVFDKEGKFLFSFGQKGEGPGEIKFAHSFHLIGDYVIVPDSGAIHYFSKDGKFVKKVVLTSRFDIKTFVDENHFVMLKSKEDNKTKTEKLELYDVRDNSRSPITELVAEKVLRAESGGLSLEMKDSNTTPSMVVGSKDKFLYFGKNDAYKITKTDLKGKPLFSFAIKGKKPKVITDTMKRKRFENISVNGGKLPAEMIKQMIKNVPDHCTYFGDIRIDDSGLIYTSISDLGNKSGSEYDIFSPDGKYLYHGAISLPDDLTPKGGLTISGDFLYTFAEDEEGERKLIKYKITKPTM
jgi:6-bladed beta-propeller protein